MPPAIFSCAGDPWRHVLRTEPPLHRRPFHLGRSGDAAEAFDLLAVQVAALAESKFLVQAHKSLDEALKIAETAEPSGSKAECLMLLFQAALKISREDAVRVADILEGLSSSTNWRVQRACKSARKILDGQELPREFFW